MVLIGHSGALSANVRNFGPSWIGVNILFHSVKFPPILLRWVRRATFVLETPSIPIKRGWHNHGVALLLDHTLSNPVDKSTDPKRLAWWYDKLPRRPDRVTYYEPEYPYTVFFEPNFGVHVPRSFGKTVIVFTSHLDLTWDKGVDLKFFQVVVPRLAEFGRRISLKLRMPSLDSRTARDWRTCT
ncbi:hypothetical protein TNCV_3918591 [Trichonephila clavipes]|nr:hypothetical protein TNCV_3918591 [Trichonephila clavipes]